MSFIQWFICLIRKDMKEFGQEMDKDPKIYEDVVSTLQNEELIEKRGGKNELHRGSQPGKIRDERGFSFLYEKTYKSKFYLALQYTKDEEAAKDVLQDAYLSAFSKLDTLKDPELFSSWFGKIVANTAINASKKKNPMLFSRRGGERGRRAF